MLPDTTRPSSTHSMAIFSRLCSKSSLKYVTFLLNANQRSKCYYDSYSTFIFIHLFMRFKVTGTVHIHNISIMPQF